MLRYLGLVAIVIGSLGGSLVSVMDPDTIPWTLYAVFLAVGVVGVAMTQLARRQDATDETLTTAKLKDVVESLEAVAEKVGVLESTWSDQEPPPEGRLGVYDLPDAIDERLPSDLARFVDAREAIAHVHGTQAYADIMGDFAAGERYLNRVWSAAAEGYVDEVRAYLTRARRQFEMARDAVQGLDPKG